MIEVKNIKKAFGNVTALHIPHLVIKKGESFGLVGNNGAGKTTFFRLLLDLIPANEGEIFSGGGKIGGNEHWKDYTGSYLDEDFLIEFLNPVEYFDFVGKLHGLNKLQVGAFLEELGEFPGDELLSGKKLIRNLSQGNKSKIGIIAALMGTPEIVILDEPFAHLDPSSQIRLKKILQRLRQEHKTTLLISSHDLKHVTEICNRIVLLENGIIKQDLETTEETLGELEKHFAV